MELAAIILFIWFTLIEIVGIALTAYAQMQDSAANIGMPFFWVFGGVIPILIAGCAEIIW